jgi:hypothetical protein
MVAGRRPGWVVGGGAVGHLAGGPPFAPDAEESISTSAGGPPAAARMWTMSIEMHLAAQRTKRLYSVLRGP